VQLVFFCALRRCESLDISGCVRLDGRIFWALAGTASTLMALTCCDIGTVRMLHDRLLLPYFDLPVEHTQVHPIGSKDRNCDCVPTPCHMVLLQVTNEH
jgi:hypothetical protein